MKPTIPNSLMPTYARLDIAFVRGQGCTLFDEKGNSYLDALSGIGVVGLGHAHPGIANIISEQASTLIHSSNIYRNRQQEALAEKLVSISGMDNCFFANSGAEANEAAIKIARLYGHSKGIDQAQIIVMENAFHGRTLATLSATASRKVQAGFEPLVPGFIRVPFNDIQAIRDIGQKNKQVVAVLLEPVQGEGGIRIAAPDYLEALATLCEEQEWLLMLDEVQCGNGRTGRYFAYQHCEVLPDVLTTAKGLGNGLPIGACLSAGKAANLMKAGNHGSTYGGNHLVCAAAMEVVATISQADFLAAVTAKASKLHGMLESAIGGLACIKQLRSHGLMLGIELHQDCPELVNKALEQGLLINVTQGNVIRLLPPLIINDDEMEQLVSILSSLLQKLDKVGDA